MACEGERRRELRTLPVVPICYSHSLAQNHWHDEWRLYVRMFDLLRVQHAGFPSCLRFCFTRNKLVKSRKPSSPACACLGKIGTQIVAKQALAYAEAALRTV